jgi:hypothetical protein
MLIKVSGILKTSQYFMRMNFSKLEEKSPMEFFIP